MKMQTTNKKSSRAKAAPTKATIKRKIERRSTSSRPDQWFIDWVTGGSPSSAGVLVSETSALKYSPFWAAVRVISGTVGSLPMITYRKNEKGRERALEHKVYPLLHDAPNEYMDALTFWETRMAHVLTYGNGYAEIQRDGAGRPVALWPLLPDRTRRLLSASGIPYYDVQVVGGVVHLPDYNVLHIKGLGFDGYTGYNVVQYHRETIGYGIAVKEYGARFFGSGANPGGVLEHPGILTDKSAKRLNDSWNSQHAGLSKAHRVHVLEEGMKWHGTGVDPQQAQALEVQKFTVDDCSRIFNIPPHKIGSLERATFSNIEEQNLEFVTSTMFYWFRKVEQECNHKLLLPAERGRMFIEILVDGLLRGNISSRYGAYSVGRQWGWLNVNEIRERENLNSIGEAGETYLEPLNMVPVNPNEPAPPGLTAKPAYVLKKPGEKKSEEAKPEKDSDDGLYTMADGVPIRHVEAAVRAAHKVLLETQWNRIIRKQTGALDHGVKPDFWNNHRAYAASILRASVAAYAAVIGVPLEKAEFVLSAIIGREVSQLTTLCLSDGQRLSERLIHDLEEC
jgi:HK97 family phage portal protein